MATPKVCLGRRVLFNGRSSCLKAARIYQAIEGPVGGSRVNSTSQTQPTSDFKNIGVGFSAGGLLFPYHIGAAEALAETGLLTSEMILSQSTQLAPDSCD